MKQIKMGLKVQVEFDAGSKKARIDCYMINPEDDRLTLSFPPSKKEYMPYLIEGTEVKAFIYSFTGILIVDSIIFDPPVDQTFVIEFNDSHEVIQRRRHLRMSYFTDFFLANEGENLRTTTSDIGGGGVKFSTEKKLINGSEYKAQLRLTQNEPLIKVQGIILKKPFYKENDYVLEFTDVKENDRNRIIQKCIELEREQNKKY